MKPLYDLLKTGYIKQEKDPVKNLKKKIGQNYDAIAEVIWDSRKQQCLKNVIDHLQSDKVIAYPYFLCHFS